MGLTMIAFDSPGQYILFVNFFDQDGQAWPEMTPWQEAVELDFWRWANLWRRFVDRFIQWRTLMWQKRPNWKLCGTAAVAALAFGLALPASAQSASDCAARAERAARGSTSIAGGAAVGAAGGAAIGAIAGNRRDARRGAAIGAVAGGATQAVRKNSRYNRVYDDCMAGY